MSTTNNLAVTELAPGQSQKDVTVNTGFEDFDNAVAGAIDINCSTGGTITLSRSQWLNSVLHLTGSPGAGFNIVVPTNKKIYVIDNASSQTATVKTPSGTGIAVAAANIQLVRSDGTNVVAINTASVSGGVTLAGDVTGPSGANTVAKVNGNTPGVAGSAHKFVASIDSSARGTLAQPDVSDLTGNLAGDVTGSPTGNTVAKVNGNTPGVAGASHKFVASIDSSARGTLVQPDFSDLTGSATDAQLAGTTIAFGFAINGVPGGSAYQQVAAPLAFTIPANMSTSFGNLGTAATTSTVFTLKKNGSAIATITFGIGGTVGTLATVGGTSKTIAANDILTLVAPATPDATASDLTFTLLGSR